MGTVLYVIYLVLLVYAWLIVARVVLSWLPARSGPLFVVRRVLHILTEPYLGIFRRIVPEARWGRARLDLSTLVGLVVLFVIIQVLIRI
jgi:YggT family protein